MPTVAYTIAVQGDDGFVQTGPTGSWPPSGPTVNIVRDTLSTYLAFTGGNYYNAQTLMRWDTSVIPADATVIAAALRFYQVGVAPSVDSRQFAADWYDWGASIDTSDYDLGAGTNAIAGVNIVGGVAPNALNAYALSNAATFVNTTGYTYLRLYTTGGTPTGDNYLEPASFDNATFEGPELLVTYTLPDTLDGNFETGDDGFYQYGAHLVFARDDSFDVAHGGIWSEKITRQNFTEWEGIANDNINMGFTPLVPGQVFTVNAWVKMGTASLADPAALRSHGRHDRRGHNPGRDGWRLEPLHGDAHRRR